MLNFKVSGQNLMCFLPEVIADGTIYYLSANFNFSDDWSTVSEKWAKFTNEDGSISYDYNLVDNGIAESAGISLDAGEWTVSLVGMIYEEAILRKRITTNTVRIYVAPSGVVDGRPLPNVTPSATEQIQASVYKAEEMALDVQRRANLGEFNGIGISAINTNEIGQFIVTYTDGHTSLCGNDLYTAIAQLKEDAETAEINATQSAVDAAASAETALETARDVAGSVEIASSKAAASSQSASDSASSASASSSSAAASAQSATDASTSATGARSWAVGGTGTRTDEDYNNSKYWSGQAKLTVEGGITEINSLKDTTYQYKVDASESASSAAQYRNQAEDAQGAAETARDEARAYATAGSQYLSVTAQNVATSRQLLDQMQANFGQDIGELRSETTVQKAAIVAEGEAQKSALEALDYENIASKVSSQSVEIAKLKALGLFIDADGDVAQHDNI